MSSMYRRNIRQLLCFMTLVMTVLMLCSIFISLTQSSISNLFATSNSTGFNSDINGALQSLEKQLTFTVLPEQLTLQEVKPTYKIPGRKWLKSLQIASSVRISSINMSLYMNSYINQFGNNRAHTSVIAFSKGGHSPPFAHI